MTSAILQYWNSMLYVSMVGKSIPFSWKNVNTTDTKQTSRVKMPNFTCVIAKVNVYSWPT